MTATGRGVIEQIGANLDALEDDGRAEAALVARHGQKEAQR